MGRAPEAEITDHAHSLVMYSSQLAPELRLHEQVKALLRAVVFLLVGALYRNPNFDPRKHMHRCGPFLEGAALWLLREARLAKGHVEGRIEEEGGPSSSNGEEVHDEAE